MDIDSLTYGQIKEITQMFGDKNVVKEPPKWSPWEVGENYFIRTVSMAITGRVVGVFPQEIVLEDAAWIADTGRFTQAVASAEFSEVEPYPDGQKVVVGRASVIDATTIPSLPRKQK
jgi:hypothetical protein